MKTVLVTLFLIVIVRVIFVGPAWIQPPSVAAGQPGACRPDSICELPAPLTDCQQTLLKIVRALQIDEKLHGVYRVTVQGMLIEPVSVPAFLRTLRTTVDTVNAFENDSVLCVVYHPKDTTGEEQQNILNVSLAGSVSAVVMATASLREGSDSVTFIVHTIPPFRNERVRIGSPERGK